MRQAVGERRAVVEDELVGAVGAGVALLDAGLEGLVGGPVVQHAAARPRAGPGWPARRRRRRRASGRPSVVALLALRHVSCDSARGRAARDGPRYHLAWPAGVRPTRSLAGCDGPYPSGSTGAALRAGPFFRRLTGDGRVNAFRCSTILDAPTSAPSSSGEPDQGAGGRLDALCTAPQNSAGGHDKLRRIPSDAPVPCPRRAPRDRRGDRRGLPLRGAAMDLAVRLGRRPTVLRAVRLPDHHADAARGGVAGTGVAAVLLHPAGLPDPAGLPGGARRDVRPRAPQRRQREAPRVDAVLPAHGQRVRAEPGVPALLDDRDRVEVLPGVAAARLRVRQGRGFCAGWR